MIKYYPFYKYDLGIKIVKLKILYSYLIEGKMKHEAFLLRK